MYWTPALARRPRARPPARSAVARHSKECVPKITQRTRAGALVVNQHGPRRGLLPNASFLHIRVISPMLTSKIKYSFASYWGGIARDSQHPDFTRLCVVDLFAFKSVYLVLGTHGNLHKLTCNARWSLLGFAMSMSLEIPLWRSSRRDS